ncbi:MAG: hypothetical protein ACRCY3_02890 [Sphingorhabdus sp.]
MDENARKGLIIGSIAMLLGIGGTGYAFYVKQTDYAPVVAVVTKVETRCFQHSGGGDKREYRSYVPSDERKCPEDFLGQTQHRDDFWSLARFNFVTYRYVSPVDGKSYEGVYRRSGYSDAPEMGVGAQIEVRAHKVEPGMSLVDGIAPA